MGHLARTPVGTVQRALAVMTAWADTPDDHAAISAVLESYAAEGDGTKAENTAAVAVGLVNLCGILLIELSEAAGMTPLEVLAQQGSFWASQEVDDDTAADLFAALGLMGADADTPAAGPADG